MIVIDATFVGKDGSMGYRKGERYRLAVRRKKIIPVGRVTTSRGARVCPYGSIEAFLANWINIAYVGKVASVEELRGHDPERPISGFSSP